MFSIKEISQKLKISANAVRFYEKKNLIKPARCENDYREFTAEDLSRLQMIVLYRKIGFSVEAISEIIDGNTEATILDQFVEQYNILNEHIHSMSLIRETMSDCIEKMLGSSDVDDEMIKSMEHTAEIIASSNNWKDLWGFDSWANTYDEDIKRNSDDLDFYRNYDEVIDITAQRIKGKDVVEIGIGTGNLAKTVLDLHGGEVSYTGIDQSINMLKLSKEKCPQVHLRTGTFLKLPLQDNSFDTVVTSYAFHHCNDEEKNHAVLEMNRVLRHNGRIVITDLMFYDKMARKLYEDNCTDKVKEQLNDEYFATVVQMEEILNMYGYNCESHQIDDLIWMLVCER